MKIFLTLFVLFFSSSVFAEDISDFQIEGMSIGDSLLDYFSKEEINKYKKNYYNDDKFIPVEFEFLPIFKIYDAVQIHFKKNDKKYIIYGLDGLIDFPKNIKDCYKKQDEIVAELSEIFKNIATKSDKKIKSHAADKSGESKTTTIYFDFASGENAFVSCYDWTKKIGHLDTLRVAFSTKELDKWVNNEAYK